MKITEIRAPRFGVWQQLALPLPSDGLTVLYGPNEAGKSTLLALIRSVLYGFEPFGQAERSTRSGPWEGGLQIARDGRRYDVARSSERGTRGLLAIAGAEQSGGSEKLLQELLQQTDQAVFENVFALGLDELQQVGSLQGDEVARHIYGMTLGPTGKKLVEGAADVEGRLAKLIDSDSRHGTLVDLWERDRALREEIAAHAALRDEYTELSGRRAQMTEKIDALKRRQADVEQQLRAHRLVERLWPHWEQVRQCRSDLDAIPRVRKFPRDGRRKFDELDGKLATSKAELEAHRRRIEQLKAERSALPGGGRIRDLRALYGFVAQRDWLGEMSQRVEGGASRSPQAADALIGWNPDRLLAFAPGDADAELTVAADRFRIAQRHHRQLVARHRRLNRAARKRAALLDEKLKPLAGQSIDVAIAQEKNRLQSLERLATLRVRESGLTQQRESLSAQLATAGARQQLPSWINVFLLVLLVGGGLVALAGSSDFAIQHNLLAGIILALTGLTGIGVAWGLKRHGEVDALETVERLRVELDRVETDYRQARDLLARTLATAGIKAGTAEDAEAIRTATSKLSDLHAWAEESQRIADGRKRLAELRARFQETQRELACERENWCAALKRLGLSETVKIGEAFDELKQIAAARFRLEAWRLGNGERDDARRWSQRFVARMEEAGKLVGDKAADYRRPGDVLARWESEIATYEQTAGVARRIRHALADERRLARNASRRVRSLQSRLRTLCLRAGARNCDDFIERAGWVARRDECAELLRLAEEELRQAGSAERDLAIVEEHFEQFESQENRERALRLVVELERLDHEIHTGFEELGGIKQSLQTLEANREMTRLQFDAAQNRYRLERAAEEWFGLQAASRALDQVREKFERTCQPAALASASHYLQRLTRGRYRNIWTRLGKRELCVDDEQGETFRVEQLSRGTREQLFLAVRMATIRGLAGQGIHLPVVLDDVLVNFDQARTESAAEALLEFAREGQQVLFFTCHLHLAHFFESKGVATTWLPSHQAAIEERRVAG